MNAGAGPAVLIVGPSWVGDMVLAQSLFKLLKQREPDCALDVLAPAWTLPLLGFMPEVRSGLALPLGHGQLGLGVRYRLGLALRAKAYRRAIVLPNAWKTALIPFWARIPVRTGYRGEQRWGLLNDLRRLDEQRLPMTVQRFAALGLPAAAELPPLPRPTLITTPEQLAQTVARLSAATSTDQPILALCPGAEYGPAKRWPAAHFAAVANAKLAQGWAVWLLGSAKDSELTGVIDTLSGKRCLDLAGKTSLAEAVNLLSLASVVVSNDSGLMHVAAALERPLLALYGSSDPRHTPPLGARARTLSLNLPCSPCFRRECPLGHLDCLRKLESARVLEAIEGFSLSSSTHSAMAAERAG
ncbi:MAG: lipopolysaccharide heptosyltransferase II [Gammaproteobacteria bacterium]